MRWQFRDVGAGAHGGTACRYLRRRRQFLGGRGHGAGGHRIGHGSGALWQPGGVRHHHEARNRHRQPRRGAGRRRRMSTLAIDIGGTKFSMAVFENGQHAGTRLTRHRSRRRPRMDAGADRSIARDWWRPLQIRSLRHRFRRPGGVRAGSGSHYPRTSAAGAISIFPGIWKRRWACCR